MARQRPDRGDERAVAFSIAFALKCDGHKVQVVADGGQALASVRVEPDAFNLLIPDHSMPGMTGVELVERFREISFCGKIIVRSAHLPAENRAAYEALTVDAMVSKPFDVHELRATVMRLANWVGPAAEKPVRLSSETLHDMLQTALSEKEESNGALEVAPESVQEQTVSTGSRPRAGRGAEGNRLGWGF